MQVWEAGHLGTKLLAHLQCQPEDWPEEVAKTASKKLDIVLIKIKPAPCSQVRKAKRNGRRGGEASPGASFAGREGALPTGTAPATR